MSELLYAGHRDGDKWVTTARNMRGKTQWVRDPDTGAMVLVPVIEGGGTGYVDLQTVAQGDSTALTASVTPTSILPPPARWSLYAGFFDRPGKTLRMRAWGRVSNIVTTPGTLTLDVRVGGVIVFNGGAMALNVVAKTNVSWQLEVLLTCRTIGNGTAATIFGMGQWTSESVVGSPLPSAGGSGNLLLPANTPAVGTGFDSTVALICDLFGTWSLNNANSILTHLYTLESLN